MARPDVLARLKELGWDGPTSYTLPYLNEMIDILEGGTSVEELKQNRRKTSAPSNGERTPRVKKEKGTWEAATPPTDAEGFTAPDVGGETEFEGVRWRVVQLEDPAGVLQYERFVPTPPKAKKAKLPGQESEFDPRAMMRVFENEDMRTRTGGIDWTLKDVEELQVALDDAQAKGETHVVLDVNGSKEQADVVWLAALVTVKRRLALREEVEEVTDA